MPCEIPVLITKREKPRLTTEEGLKSVLKGLENIEIF